MAMTAEEFNELEQLVLATAKRHGWVIRDLNDNDTGLRVKGPHWQARLDAETPIYAWTRAGLAEELARWILRGEIE